LGPSFKLKDLHITTKKRTDVAPVLGGSFPRARMARAARDRANAWSVRSSRMPDPISRSAIPAGQRGSPSPAPVRGRRRSARRGPAPCQQERARLERTALRRPPRRDAVRRDTVPALNTHHTMQVARRHSKVVNTVRLRASCLMLHASTVTIGSCPILSRSPGAEPRDFVFDGFWEWLSFIEHGGERGCDCVARTTILDGSMSRWLH
jgi:hypothetical protein